MKKGLPYILVALALVALVLILVSTNRHRQFNERVSLRQKDKIPYGDYVAYNLLPKLFPRADIKTDRNEPLEWINIEHLDSNQLVILNCGWFYPEEIELKRIARFAQNGNHVFIIAASISYEVNKFFDLSSSFLSDEGYTNRYGDSMTVKLESPPFQAPQSFTYPGRSISFAAKLKDTQHGIILGRNRAGLANFIYFRSGRGSITLNLSPLAFSNYFLLHKNNIHYFEQAFSVIPSNVARVDWNEYYLTSKRKTEEPNFLNVLFRYPSFKWALLTAAATILLFALLYMRRRQRIIPVIQEPANESLDFIKTIGRLYYDKKDHVNLARKMALYFLDHVRQKYLIATHTLNDDFILVLHEKSGYDHHELQDIVFFINYLKDNPVLNEYQLARFHHQLENFYQNS